MRIHVLALLFALLSSCASAQDGIDGYLSRHPQETSEEVMEATEEVDRIRQRKIGELAEDPEVPQRDHRGRRKDVSLAYVGELLFPPGFIDAVTKDFRDDELAGHLRTSRPPS